MAALFLQAEPKIIPPSALYSARQKFNLSGSVVVVLNKNSVLKSIGNVSFVTPIVEAVSVMVSFIPTVGTIFAVCVCLPFVKPMYHCLVSLL